MACSQWYNHPTVSLWGNSMHECCWCCMLCDYVFILHHNSLHSHCALFCFVCFFDPLWKNCRETNLIWKRSKKWLHHLMKALHTLWFCTFLPTALSRKYSAHVVRYRYPRPKIKFIIVTWCMLILLRTIYLWRVVVIEILQCLKD